MARQTRLYVPRIEAGPVRVTGPEAHHARSVLRLGAGETVELFDGAGRSAAAQVRSAGKDALELTVGEIRTDPPAETRLVLATAIPKGPVQPCLVSHAAEVGVDAFWPVVCRYSAVRDVSAARWQRWLVETCKQSGRNSLPEVAEPVTLAEALDRSGDFDLKVFGSTQSDQPAREPLAKAWRTAIVFVGPEGGLCDEEERLLIERGVQPVRLGCYVMRVETAAAALAALLIGNREPRR